MKLTVYEMKQQPQKFVRVQLAWSALSYNDESTPPTHRQHG